MVETEKIIRYKNPEERKQGIYKITIIGAIANCILLAIKFLAGFLGNSAAMIADAVHSLSDFVTDIVVLAFARISAKPKDKNHDYGHGKYETFATLIIGGVLIVVGAGILANGVEKIHIWYSGGELERPDHVALYAALISIVVKEVLYRMTVVVGRKAKSQMLMANAWHHRSDALSSIGTAIGIGGAIFLGDKWVVLDPLAAVVVSIFIIKVAVDLMLPSVKDLLEHSLSAEEEERIVEVARSVEGVNDPHNLKTRKIGNDIAIDIHLRVDPQMSVHDAHEIATRVEYALREEYGEGSYISTHIEPIKK